MPIAQSSVSPTTHYSVALQLSTVLVLLFFSAVSGHDEENTDHEMNPGISNGHQQQKQQQNSVDHPGLQISFEAYCKMHGISFQSSSSSLLNHQANEDELLARQKFNASLKKIEYLNKQSKTGAKFGLGMFALMDEKEWQEHFPKGIVIHHNDHDEIEKVGKEERIVRERRYGGRFGNMKQLTFTDAQIAEAMKQTVNWHSGENPKNIHAVTRVKNQGTCGSCWAFSAVACLESMWAMSDHPLTAFSEQFILDCFDNGNALNGCSGGDVSILLGDMVGRLIPMEKDYEYISYDKATESCNGTQKAPGVGASSIGYSFAVTSGQFMEEVMTAFVYNYGPIAVSVNAENDAWKHYESGIMDTCPPNIINPSQLDHGVTVIGYGVEQVQQEGSDKVESVPYWLVKNSWTPLWGEKGYLKIKRGVNECGIAMEPFSLGV